MKIIQENIQKNSPKNAMVEKLTHEFFNTYGSKSLLGFDLTNTKLPNLESATVHIKYAIAHGKSAFAICEIEDSDIDVLIINYEFTTLKCNELKNIIITSRNKI